MSDVNKQDHFFGFRVRALQQDLITAWREMLLWSVLAWLWPKLPVRLWLPSGAAVASMVPGAASIDLTSQAKSVHFEAVQLPETLLLRTSLRLPQLQTHELMSALALHTRELSPFAVQDLVWTHESEASCSDNDVMLVHLVMSSRKLVNQYVTQAHPQINLATTEIWVPSTIGNRDLVFPGFGETARSKSQYVRFLINVGLMIIVFVLVAALAATPSVQLFLRTQQAHLAMANLQQQAVSVVKKRESLVATTDQLNELTEIMGKQLPPLYILKLITDALPDDTSLLSLKIQGYKVSISGQTKDATALMKQLGGLPGLRDVTAPAPATKPLGAPLEQFSIDFTIDSTQLHPAK